MAGVLLGFSRSGWSSSAESYATTSQQTPPTGKNWICSGVRLLDINQIDTDLVAWSQ